jgi:prepilin-type N-terminal cleavage/methylation domain-containing protein
MNLRRRKRGFNLVELMISVTIVLLVITAATYLFIVVNNSLRRTRMIADAQEGARLGLAGLESDLHMAGLGFGSGQVGIAPGAGSGRRIPAVYLGPNITITEPGGQTVITNSVFVLMSNPTTISIPFSNSGTQGVVVAATATTPLQIQCGNAAGTNVDCGTMISTTTWPPLIVGDFFNAVYMTPTALSTFSSGSPTQSLTYAEEAGAAYAPDPHAPFGFTPGANVSIARVVHWYLKQTGTGQPQLMRSYPKLTSSALPTNCSSTDVPFVDETNGGTVVGKPMGTTAIENLQIRFVTDPYQSDNPQLYTMVNSIGVCDVGVPSTVRSIRVQVEAIADDVDLSAGNGQAKPIANYATPLYEGVSPSAATQDAYPRRAFSMTIVPRNLQGSRI